MLDRAIGRYDEEVVRLERFRGFYRDRMLPEPERVEAVIGEPVLAYLTVSPEILT